jgi:hypothetical protein
MSVIIFRVEQSDPEPGEGSRSRNVDVFCKTVLATGTFRSRLRDFDWHSVSPLGTKLYSGDQFSAGKRSMSHQPGELCS